MLYLCLALCVTVPLLIRAEFRFDKKQIYLLKPLSTLLVIAVAAISLGAPSHDATYTVGLLIGLALCLGGDVALMFQDRRRPFLAGLVLFLLGHVAYAVTFHLLGGASAWELPATVALLVAGIGFYWLIRAGLGGMRLPVIAYFLIISAMVSRAVSLQGNVESGVAALAIGGALAFYVSDVILAANRFWKPWRHNRISLAFYYGGQLLIALSASQFA